MKPIKVKEYDFGFTSAYILHGYWHDDEDEGYHVYVGGCGIAPSISSLRLAKDCLYRYIQNELKRRIDARQDEINSYKNTSAMLFARGIAQFDKLRKTLPPPKPRRKK